jgi:hypothetical protein
MEPYKLHAIAHNAAGNSTDLGVRTITVDNFDSLKPFGTIDTPGQGETVSGNAYINFGWALAQTPKAIPQDGSTMTVVVDGQVIGHPVYNQYSSGIANFFPNRANSDGAVGFFYLDTTKLTNGIHSLSWVVYDNNGVGDGVGSRYINVQNPGHEAGPEVAGLVKRVDHPRLYRGYDVSREAEPILSDEHGTYTVELEELGRIELHLGAMLGHQLVNGQPAPLPPGSSLKDGVFYLQGGPGLLGDYQLVFERPDGDEIRVRLRVGGTTQIR